MPVDFGMFFFTLANAGVNLRGGGGPLTIAIVGALVIGKILGIVGMVLLFSKLNLAPVNSAIKKKDLVMLSSNAAIGLTVALFVAGEAFPNQRLQSEAKFGALLSGLMGVICFGVHKGGGLCKGGEAPERSFRSRLSFRQDAFVKHKIRAGEGALEAHPSTYQKPELLDFERLRAQKNWASLKSKSSKVLPVAGLARDESGKMTDESVGGVLAFMAKKSGHANVAAETNDKTATFRKAHSERSLSLSSSMLVTETTEVEAFDAEKADREDVEQAPAST